MRQILWAHLQILFNFPCISRPRPFRFERLRVLVWNPYSRGRPAPAKTQNTKGAEKKTATQLTNFLNAEAPRVAPQLAATPWGGSPPRPLCQKICYSDCTENCPLRPLRAPRRFRNPKIRQQLGAQPTPMFRVMLDALLDALLDAMIDPLPPFTFCCPQAIVDQDAGVSIPNLISLLPLDEAPVHVHRFAARAPCDSKGSECQCGIHTGEAASALRSRKTERAAKEKPTPISQFFFRPSAPYSPQPARHAPGRLPTRPLCRKIQPNVLRCNRLARGGPPGDIIPGNCRTEGEAGFYSLTPRTPTRR